MDTATPLSESDKVAMAVGHAITTWALVEHYVTIIFAAHSGLSNDRALIVMEGIVSFDARLKCCSSIVLKFAEFDPLQLRTWSLLVAAASDEYRCRNKIAHSGFLYEAKTGNKSLSERRGQLIAYYTPLKAHDGAKHELSETWIKNKTADFMELARCFQWVWLNSSSDQRSAPPKPDLLRQFQEKAAQKIAGAPLRPKSSVPKRKK
jgi:hypothetical protein